MGTDHEYEPRRRAIELYEADAGSRRSWTAWAWYGPGWPSGCGDTVSTGGGPAIPKLGAQPLASRDACTDRGTGPGAPAGTGGVARQTRRFSGLGAEAIRLHLERERARPLPSVLTIGRIWPKNGYPHRALQVGRDGTRFPGLWLERHQTEVRALPPTCSLDQYCDGRGRLCLPVARGRVSFIRRVDAEGRIEVNGKPYPVGRRLTGRYVTATTFTHRQILALKVDNRVHARFPFPIRELVVPPILPVPRGRI